MGSRCRAVASRTGGRRGDAELEGEAALESSRFRCALRRWYLAQLRAIQFLDGEGCLAAVRTSDLVAVGRLVALDPDHLNLVLQAATVLYGGFDAKASRMIVRGDSVRYVFLGSEGELEALLDAFRP
ncbi:MAG: LSM domain-containing protein [Desulfurococcaceae archaeon]